MTALRSTQCTATSRRSGERCRKMATLGATVCCKHGASAPQVRAAARRRITLAEAMERGDRRNPLEVLSDAMHVADVVAQQMQAAVSAGEFTAEHAQALVEATKLQAQMAKLALDSGVDPVAMMLRHRDIADGLARIVDDILSRLGLHPGRADVRAAVEGAVRTEVGRRQQGGPPAEAFVRRPRAIAVAAS